MLKSEGNDLFKAARFELAVEKYTQVIEKVSYTYGEPMNPLLVSCYNNRAACYQQLGFYRKVTEDCSIVIEVSLLYYYSLQHSYFIHIHQCGYTHTYE